MSATTHYFNDSSSILMETMESGAGTRDVQEESDTQAARYQKRRGFATAKGEDYEVALCCLLFLRALRHASDFFLASNHDLAGIFDDVVLFYRLQGDRAHEYRAILLQAKHRERITKKKFTLSNPFSLQDYLKSFKEIKNHWEHSLKAGNIEIQLKEIILVLYTNTGCVIDEAAVDVTNFPQEQHLQQFLDTGGRLLRISDGQRLGMPQGQETSDFLSHLLLCTEQKGVDMTNSILEEELCNFFRLTSPEVARKLNTELKRVMKDWWSEEGTVRYLTAECKELKKVFQMQITRLNEDTINIDRQFKIEFTDVAVELSDVVSPLELRWICVRDEYQANAVRSRLFRAQQNSLVISVKFLVDHVDEVEALWRNKICPILVLDMSAASPEEASPMLQRLQEEVQSDAGRRLVVIAKGKPTSAGWTEVDAEPTWSVLQQVSRDRLLEAPVRLQGKTVPLRDVVGSHASDVMTDEIISSVCECETEVKLGAAMPAPLEYDLPRCLQRSSSNTFNVDTLTNTNILIFSSNYHLQENEFTKQLKSVHECEIKAMTAVKYPTIVEGIPNDYDIRKLCFRFRVRGISGEISMKGLQGDIKEFIPFTWTCEEKIVLIEGPPGVGKSSFVTMMCSTLKEQFPEAWVLRLDMGRHTDYIKDTDFTEVSHIKEFVLKGLQKDPNNLEQELLEHSLSVAGNVFLFLDAFDEISPDFTSKCCDLLKGIAQTISYRQMVVTTRPVTTKDVEGALQAKAFTLPVFSEEEQGIFLKQFSAAKGKQVDEEEISSLRQSAGPALEIPLLCRMAAEVLMHGREQLLLKCQNPWRRILLYDAFVEQSIMERVAEKLELDVSKPGLKILLESHKNSHLHNLQGLAVRKLMPAANLPPLSVSTVTPEEKLGLVVNTGGKVDFKHQTFAEYFLGCWLACHWQQCPRKLLRDVLFRDGFKFVATTFSWSLFVDLPLHMAVAQGDEDLIVKHLSPSTTDRGGRSALHVAAMTKDVPRKVWELLMASSEDLNRKDDVLGASAVKYAEVFCNWEFVDLGLQNGANIDYLKFFAVKEAANEVLIYAVKSDLVCLCQFIWRRHSNIFQNLPLLHLAAANNSKLVLKLLIEKHYKIKEINESEFTPLQEASRHGHVEVLKILLDKGSDLNVKTKYGDTVLTLAARRGHLEVVKTFLEKGAELNIKTKYGESALTLAAGGGHLDVVKILLQKAADLNVRTVGGKTALTEAARGGHLEVVKILLEKGADLYIKTKYGDTALTLAARRGHLEVVKIFLEKGADVNIKTKYGESALTLAAGGGHAEVVKILLQKGADLNVKTAGGKTALMEAARGGHLEAMKILLQKGADGNTALTLAANRGQLDVVNVLLQKGADVNIKTKYGESAVTLAAGEGHLEVLKILLQNGADLNVKTACGKTALTLAARGGHLEVAMFLLEKGADFNIKSVFGNTALTEAVVGGHQEVVKILLEKGPCLNLKTADGNTALTLAAREGHLDMVKMILEKGADFDIKSEDGDTALTLAARGGHLKVVKILLEKRADLNIRTLFGYTALMGAARGGHLEVVKILLQKGADFNIMTADGNTALTRAAAGGHLEVVKILLEKGADINLKTFTGDSALTVAASGGHLEVVKMLLQKGADVNANNFKGESALMLADKGRHREVVAFLRQTVRSNKSKCVVG